MPMKTLLVRPGSIFPEIISVHGDFHQWFIRASGLASDQFVTVDPSRDLMPDLPPDCDRVLITGSLDSAFADHPWIDELEKFIRWVAEREIPLFGVCFGAQIITTALGGRVEVNSRGCELGTIQVELLPEARQVSLFQSLPQNFFAQASHDDHVVHLPEGAELLATNGHSRVQAYRIGSCIHAVQFHPEISMELMREIIQRAVAKQGLDREKGRDLLQRVEPTPEARSLLNRFLA